MAIEKTISPEDFDTLGAEGQRHYLVEQAIRHLPAGDEVDESRRCLNQLFDMTSDDVAAASDQSPAIGPALQIVLDALAVAQPRDRLRTALMAVLDNDHPLYRQHLTALLAAPAQTLVLSSAAVAREVRPRPSHLRLVRPAPPHRIGSSEKPIETMPASVVPSRKKPVRKPEPESTGQRAGQE